jgi:hypothetical protein
MEEEARTNERLCYCLGRQDKDERVGIRFSIHEKDGELGPTSADLSPDESHGRTTVAYHYHSFFSCARLYSKVFYLGPIYRGRVRLSRALIFIIHGAAGPVDTKTFYFDIYVDGKVRWRVRSCSSLYSCMSQSWLAPCLPVDSSIKEQHDNNNVTLDRSHGIMHVINDGGLACVSVCAFFCSLLFFFGNYSSLDLLTTLNDWK